ncbi:hypothetical protein [Halobacteriovorax sp. YZS-1-1]|uniref:hypothetical protein n=1 Tax=unclassified Halobacteriovorax TaxID=2639665 RepID=UPI00399C375B
MADSKDNKKEYHKEGLLGDTIKKVVSIGIGAAFMTEEAVKKVIDDLPLPNDVVNGLLANAKKSKQDFIDSVQEELRHYLKNVDPKTLLESILDDYEVVVRFKKRDDKKTK